MGETWPLASKKRIILATYLDYLVFTAPWLAGVWVAARILPGLDREPQFVKLGLFVVLEILLFRVVRWSPGQYLLGIVEAHRASAFQFAGPLDGRPVFLVDPGLLARERWWTVLIGVLLILDGSKAIVRWTQFTPPMPWFGVVPPLAVAALGFIALGTAELCIGAGVLRLRRFILPLAAVVFGLQTASGLVSWPRWPEWAAQYVTARRAFQGVPVRAGEVEMAQAVMPALMVGAPVVAFLCVLAVHRRTTRPAG